MGDDGELCSRDSAGHLASGGYIADEVVVADHHQRLRANPSEVGAQIHGRLLVGPARSHALVKGAARHAGHESLRDGIPAMEYSWGGVTSLAIPGGNETTRPDYAFGDRLVRLNIGLESTADLIVDLDQALGRLP